MNTSTPEPTNQEIIPILLTREQAEWWLDEASAGWAEYQEMCRGELHPRAVANYQTMIEQLDAQLRARAGDAGEGE